MNADVINLRRITGQSLGASAAQAAGAASAVATAAAQGGVNIASDVGAAVAAISLLSTIGSSPGKQTYDNIYYPNAKKFVAAYGRNFVGGGQAQGIDPVAIADSLSDKLAEVGTGPGVNLTPAQLMADAQPATTSTTVSNLLSGGVGTYIAIGGAALLLVLLLKK